MSPVPDFLLSSAWLSGVIRHEVDPACVSDAPDNVRLSATLRPVQEDLMKSDTPLPNSMSLSFSSIFHGGAQIEARADRTGNAWAKTSLVFHY